MYYLVQGYVCNMLLEVNKQILFYSYLKWIVAEMTPTLVPLCDWPTVQGGQDDLFFSYK